MLSTASQPSHATAGAISGSPMSSTTMTIAESAAEMSAIPKSAPPTISKNGTFPRRPINQAGIHKTNPSITANIGAKMSVEILGRMKSLA